MHKTLAKETIDWANKNAYSHQAKKADVSITKKTAQTKYTYTGYINHIIEAYTQQNKHFTSHGDFDFIDNKLIK